MDLSKYGLVDGEIHSLHRKEQIKYYRWANGEAYVRLVDEDNVNVHQLALERAKLILRDGSSPVGFRVRFVDGDVLNYDLDNLTWEEGEEWERDKGALISASKRKAVIARHMITRKDTVYGSLAEAADRNKTTSSTICKAIKSKRPCKGYHWMYV